MSEEGIVDIVVILAAKQLEILTGGCVAEMEHDAGTLDVLTTVHAVGCPQGTLLEQGAQCGGKLFIVFILIVCLLTSFLVHPFEATCLNRQKYN